MSKDGYSIRDYGRMISDRARTEPFVEALRRALRPGDVVLDIGTGTGFFAMLACRLGAGKVYAIEPSDAIEVARASARLNPGCEQIEWIQGLSTELSLPERADVVIADLHGFLPFFGTGLVSMIDARKRHLEPGGVLIPNRDVLYAAPAEAADEYHDVESPWSLDDLGLDLSPGRDFVANSVWRANWDPVSKERFLADARSWGTIDYREIEQPNLEGRVEWTATRAGKLHGFYVWFDGETSDGLGFSNAPFLPSLPYGRTFFPLRASVAVEPGYSIAARFAANLVRGEYVLRWDTLVRDAGGEPKVEFHQSTFKDRPIAPEGLRRANPGWIPRFNAAGEVARLAFASIAAGKPSVEIARELATVFPERFADATAASAAIADLLGRYCE